MSLLSKWGTDTTLKFLEAYEQQECLWNHEHPYYKNKSIRNNALEQIVDVMRFEDFKLRDAKSKIHALRATYISERKRVRDSLRAVNAGLTTKIYQPKLAWYPIADKFLRKVIQLQSLKTESKVGIKLLTIN